MACKVHQMSPFFTLFDNMGIDRTMLDSGILGFRDYAEDFLSRLGQQQATGQTVGDFVSELFKELAEQSEAAKSPEPQQFQMKVNVRGYEPKDLRIRVENGVLIVSGKHEHESEDGQSSESRQFERRMKLPEDIILDEMKSHLNKNVLAISAPIKPKPVVSNERVIPIEMEVDQPEKPKATEAKTAEQPKAAEPLKTTTVEKANDDEPVVEDAFEELE